MPAVVVGVAGRAVEPREVSFEQVYFGGDQGDGRLVQVVAVGLDDFVEAAEPRLLIQHEQLGLRGVESEDEGVSAFDPLAPHRHEVFLAGRVQHRDQDLGPEQRNALFELFLDRRLVVRQEVRLREPQSKRRLADSG